MMIKRMSPTKKKKIKEPQTGPTFPKIREPKQKINPKKCLVFPKIKYTRNKYNEFRIKRFYCKVFTLDDSFLYYYDRAIRKPITFCRKQRYLKGLEIISVAVCRTANTCKLIRSIPRLQSLRIELGSMAFFQLLPKQGLIGTIFKNVRPNLTSLGIEILLGFGVNTSIIPSFVNSIIKSLKMMININSLHLIINNHTSNFTQIIESPSPAENVLKESPSEMALKKLCQTRFQRLKKLETLKLIFCGLNNPVLRCFTQSFEHLYKLKDLEVVSFDQAHGKKMIESISRTSSLNSLTIYYSIEPNDILALLPKLSQLRRIVIKDDWLFEQDDLPLLKALNPNNVNVLQLDLDLPLYIETKEDVSFISNFLGVFKKLHFLKLYLCCQSEQVLPYPLASVINTLTSLEGLTLELYMISVAVTNQFLNTISNLANLKRLSLVIKQPLDDVWTKDTYQLCKALKFFLSQSKCIESIELYWEKLVPQCITIIKDILKKFVSLAFFKLVYTSAYKIHGRNHEKTLNELEDVMKTLTGIKRVTIITSCTHHSFKNCESKGTGISQVIALHKNIQEFLFITNKRVQTPFYEDKLE